MVIKTSLLVIKCCDEHPTHFEKRVQTRHSIDSNLFAGAAEIAGQSEYGSFVESEIATKLAEQGTTLSSFEQNRYARHLAR